MEDVESFTLVNSPAPEQDPFSDYEQHSAAARKATVVVLSKTLRQRHPGHVLAVTLSSTCDILGFCNAGLATLSDWNPRLAVRHYQAPINQLDNQQGLVLHQPVFAKCCVTYEHRDYFIYIAECLKEGSFNPLQMHTFILCRPRPNEPLELASFYIDGLILQASKWTLELHNEIWIFDQLRWQKSRELWQSAQEADWDDVILDEGMKQSVRDDIEGFFDEREEYKRFGIPWKVCIP